MAKGLSYKRQQSLTLKAQGIVDIDKMTIEIDGETKFIQTLLKDFDGLDISLQAKVADDVDLDEPTAE